jgi:hypothetical protein
MSILDELKKTWGEKQSSMPDPPAHDHESLEKIIRSRVKKNMNAAFKYFWLSFTFQVLVYSLLSHVIIKYWGDRQIFYLSIAGVLLFLPFTIMLMQKFKKLATTKISIEENRGASLHDFVLRQQTLLRNFYSFKKWYELFLMPLSSAIGIIITFKLYVPGGVVEHWVTAIIIFIITLISCMAAIHSENKKSFRKPIRQLQNILEEFKDETK